jgi:adenylosuccinate synthase
VCVAYELDGKRYDQMPYHQSVLHKVTPIYEELPGWQSDLSTATEPSDMPREAKDFVDLIAQQAGVPIRLVGVGPSRDQFVHFASSSA